MLNDSAVRRRSSLTLPLVLALAFGSMSSTLAHASELLLSTNCSASGDSLKCHLSEFLWFLYATAGVLGIVLVIVIALTVQSYLATRKDDKNGS